MTVFERYAEWIEDHERMYGRHRGKPAVAMDLLTEAMVAAGAHAIYCRQSKHPEEPSADLRTITEYLDHAKQLVQVVLRDLFYTLRLTLCLEIVA